MHEEVRMDVMAFAVLGLLIALLTVCIGVVVLLARDELRWRKEQRTRMREEEAAFMKALKRSDFR